MTNTSNKPMFHKIFSILMLVVFGLSGLAIDTTRAIEALRIISVESTVTNTTATIKWSTNREASGIVEYGLHPNNLGTFADDNRKRLSHTMTLSKLEPETKYYFRITAESSTSEAHSIVQEFKTGKSDSNEQPRITSRIRAVYMTGTTATIQWLTNVSATSEVEYGLTTSYGKRGSASKGTTHDVTLRGLKKNKVYHFRVKSKDSNNNSIVSGDMTFKTERTLDEENGVLKITNITPISENDPKITQTSAVITWRTNKLASGWVKFQKSSGGKSVSITEPLPRKFVHAITLTELTPNTAYNIEIGGKDVFGKTVTTRLHTVTTRDGSVSVATVDGGSVGDSDGHVLGSFACVVDSEKDFGYFGMYYNLSSDHPDIGLHNSRDKLVNKIGNQNDWYDEQYFSLSRVDQTIDFPGKFLPLDEGKPGDPFFFAVHWRSMIVVPETGNYEYTLRSDDDSWVFIDNKLTTDLGGLHGAKDKKQSVYLTKGKHKLEIYYAERNRGGAVFSFKPDPKLKFYPLPDGCEISDIQNGGGQVLGSSTLDYTKAIALYKTTGSPDIYAIYANGLRHYISGPTAFGNYGYNINRVQTVSQATLEKYPEARLVKVAGDDTVYYIYQRPDHQWLKLAIPSATVFISYPGNHWGNVISIDQADLNTYPDAQLITLSSGGTVYLLDGNIKKPFASIATLQSMGYNVAEVITVNETHLTAYTTGETLR